jgi:glycerate 2-kinase
VRHHGSVRILVAPDCFTGSLTAPQAAEAIASGWSAGAPHDSVRQLPLADGGPGFLEVVRSGLGGDLLSATVEGPRGAPAPGLVLLCHGDGGPTAYLESAQATGLHLLALPDRDPTRTTSRGLGTLVRAALDAGARRIVVGLGGSATNDAGAGVLAGLGMAASALGEGGGGLDGLRREDLEPLVELRRELAGVDLVGAVDVDVPLLGLHGASAGFAAQKGATPEQAQELERSLGHFARLVGEVVAGDDHRRDLLSPDRGGKDVSRRLAQLPGAGAAGGVGFALAALGGRLVPGAAVVADAVGLPERLAEADLVVTGEGALDWQSLHGKVVHAVAMEALKHAVPAVAVAGQVLIGRREWSAAGLAAAYAVAEHPEDVEAALADPSGTLAARTARVARTWSR